MPLPKSIKNNLHFLCVEVDSQISNLQQYFATPTSSLARRILDRKGYTNNLKMSIHGNCLEQLAKARDGSHETMAFRAIEFVATDLEKITELCRGCIKQIDNISDIRSFKATANSAMLERVKRSLQLIEPSLHEHDTRLAVKIGQIATKLDRDYQRLLKYYTLALKQRKKTKDLTCALFAAYSIEQMGDTLLNIAESIISANLGQPINFERYHSLQESIEHLDGDDISEMQIDQIAETKSGSGISGIVTADSKNDEYAAIFKAGIKHKLKEEKDGVNNWHEIYPGLAPKIISYKKRGQSAAMLIEHLPGLTIEQILLNESPELLKESLDYLEKTLTSVWQETQTNQPVSADFMQQLERRLDDAYKIHPEFQKTKSAICGVNIPDFNTLITHAQAIEAKIRTPFSVYIHGDFNLDNIIYDPIEHRINFIDLHRSRYMDYVQDVSVFMVSNYRLQILDPLLRQRIMQLAKDFYKIARRYAKQVNDDTFEIRLALGLARSFATSTRFILDKSLARSMFLRARYLIELVLATNHKNQAKFKTPVQEIFVG